MAALGEQTLTDVFAFSDAGRDAKRAEPLA